MMGGGNTFRLLDSLYAPRRGRGLWASGSARARLATWARRPAPTWPARPSAPPTTCPSVSRRASRRWAWCRSRSTSTTSTPIRPRPYMGETREERIEEFLEENDCAVLAMYEGSWLRVSGERAAVTGRPGCSPATGRGLRRRRRRVRAAEPHPRSTRAFGRHGGANLNDVARDRPLNLTGTSR